MGMGLRTLTALDAHEFIGQYFGKVTAVDLQLPHESEYLVNTGLTDETGKTYCIDAMTMGSDCRFINSTITGNSSAA